MKTHTRIAISILTLLLCFGGLAQAQPSANPWDEAREAYRLQDWGSAQRHAALASQREPDEPRYYFALARITFQQGAFDDAVWFYDTFLRLAAEQKVDFPGSYAVARAEAERASANARREDPSEDAPEPEAQRRVREALLQRLEEGPILSGYSGALATFQTLVQIGYANPDFSALRARLHAAAIQEAEQIMSANGPYLPTLHIDAIEEQLRRYQASDLLVPAPVPFDGESDTRESATRSQTARQLAQTAARRATLTGQQQLMNGNFSIATEQFRAALQQAPSDLYAHQALINSLFADNADKDEILRAIARFEAADADHPALPIYKALGESSARAHRNAASMLYQLLIQP